MTATSATALPAELARGEQVRERHAEQRAARGREQRDLQREPQRERDVGEGWHWLAYFAGGRLEPGVDERLLHLGREQVGEVGLGELVLLGRRHRRADVRDRLDLAVGHRVGDLDVVSALRVAREPDAGIDLAAGDVVVGLRGVGGEDELGLRARPTARSP